MFASRGGVHCYYFNRDNPTKTRPLLSVYCIMGATGYLSPILRSLLVFPTRCDSFTTAGLRLGSFLTCQTAAALRLSHNPPPILTHPAHSLSLSPLRPLCLSIWNTLFFSLSFPHTENDIKPSSARLKEDSRAYFKPKVLISHNRLLCGSRGGSPVFLSFFK